MMQSRNVVFFDSHCLCFEETQKKIRAIIHETCIILGKPNDMFFEINVLKDKYLNDLGYGYIWIDDDEITNIIAGLNKDGSERVLKYNDPSWISPVVPKDQELNKINENLSWSDQMDEYDTICEKHTPKQIEEKMDPLLDLNKFIKFIHNEETKQQYSNVRKKKMEDRLVKYEENVKKIHEKLKQKLLFYEKDKLKEDLKYLIAEIEDMKNTSDDFFIKQIPDTDMIKLEKAIIDPSRYENLYRNILVSHNVPRYIDEIFLRKRLCRYVTKLRDKDSNRKEYPIIKIYKENSRVVIYFSKESLDAEFCLLMIKKLYFISPEGKTEYIMFNHLKKNR